MSSFLSFSFLSHLPFCSLFANEPDDGCPLSLSGPSMTQQMAAFFSAILGNESTVGLLCLCPKATLCCCCQVKRHIISSKDAESLKRTRLSCTQLAQRTRGQSELRMHRQVFAIILYLLASCCHLVTLCLAILSTVARHSSAKEHLLLSTTT